MILLANTGLPMIAVIWPVSWMLIIPIILAEWGVAHRILMVPAKQSLLVVLYGNLASTFLAVPLVWGIVLVLGMKAPNMTPDSFWGVINNVVLHSAWLLPWNGAANWMVPAAAFTLCIPFFLASVWIEGGVARLMLHSTYPDARCRRWAWSANAVTYGALMACLFALAIYRWTPYKPLR